MCSFFFSTSPAQSDDVFVSISLTTNDTTDAETRIDEIFISSVTNELEGLTVVDATTTLSFSKPIESLIAMLGLRMGYVHVAVLVCSVSNTESGKMQQHLNGMYRSSGFL